MALIYSFLMILVGWPLKASEIKELVYNRLPTTKKQVVLTFDDGPSLQVTPKILAILKKFNIQALFFILGERARRYPELVEKIVNEGHLLGNHSVTHPNMTKLSKTAQLKELQETQAIIDRYAKPTNGKWFRPPFGAMNASLKEVAKTMGMSIILWSVDPKDWSPQTSPEEICEKVQAQVKPGSIVLLHDIHGRTALALERIIKDLLQKGYEFVSLPPSWSVAR